MGVRLSMSVSTSVTTSGTARFLEEAQPLQPHRVRLASSCANPHLLGHDHYKEPRELEDPSAALRVSSAGWERVTFHKAHHSPAVFIHLTFRDRRVLKVNLVMCALGMYEAPYSLMSGSR